MADVFSVVAMFILFREALEASIIISIMLQMCDRLKLKKSKRQGTVHDFDMGHCSGRAVKCCGKFPNVNDCKRL